MLEKEIEKQLNIEPSSLKQNLMVYKNKLV